MKRFAPVRWREHWRVDNNAFGSCALIDLCHVRSEFREQERWPELLPLLEQVFVMACVYLAHTIEMDDDEKERFFDDATPYLSDFRDHPERTHQDQLSRIMEMPGLDKRKVHKGEFVKAAIVEPSWLDPFQLIKHYDRVSS